MNKRNLILYLLFAVIVLIVLSFTNKDINGLKFIFKPLIMVWISGYFILNLKDRTHPVVKPALFAFFFSWLGDIALLFSGILYFLSGLGAFLIAQLFYIYLFQQTEDRVSPSLLRKNPMWILPFIVYGVTLLSVLLPGTSNTLKPAVIIYSITVLTMAASALNRMGRVPPDSFQTVLAGAVLFVISDSLIAINKFAVKIPNGGFWVMLTYISAQILIMSGLFMQVNGKK